MFPETAWGTIRDAGQGTPEVRFEALRRLAERYEPAIRATFRKLGAAPHEVDDLVQGFFEEKFLKPQFLAGLEVEGGRFRGFIGNCLRNYRRTVWRRNSKVRQQEALSADLLEVPGAEIAPDLALDRSWARQLMELARQRLRREAEEAGISEIAHHFEAQLDGVGPLASHEELGSRLGKSANAVGVALHRMRERYAWLLYEEIRQTVSDPTQWRAERDHLVSLLTGG